MRTLPLPGTGRLLLWYADQCAIHCLYCHLRPRFYPALHMRIQPPRQP